jgi:hypothetical protein
VVKEWVKRMLRCGQNFTKKMETPKAASKQATKQAHSNYVFRASVACESIMEEFTLARVRGSYTQLPETSTRL